MPRVLVSGPQRITPPHYPYPILWRQHHWQTGWQAQDSCRVLLLCRGARIAAKRVTCDTKSTHWGSWTKAFGSLWILDDNTYEIRKEIKDLPQHFEAIRTGNFAQPVVHTTPFHHLNPPLPHGSAELTGYLPGYEED